MNSVQKIMHVEGNIGSGKTTLMYYLQGELKKFDIECQKEPVDQWTSHQGHNYLKIFYENPARYIFPLQMHIMRTISEQTLKERPKVSFLITERSMLSQHHVFVQTARERNILEETEYVILNDWHHQTLSRIPKPVAIVYLRADPRTCYSRILQRERKEEVSHVNFDYVTAIHDRYEEWIGQVKKDIPVHEIDANSDLRDQLSQYEKVKELILEIKKQ